MSASQPNNDHYNFQGSLENIGMHKSLERQLTHIYGLPENVPKEQKPLLELVNKTYTDNDNEYGLMERALAISSQELTEANKLLREENEEIEKKVKQRTTELSQERSKLDKIAQNMNTGAILLDEDAKVTFANHRAKEIIGLSDNDNSKVLEKFFNKFKKYSPKKSLKKCMHGNAVKISEAEADYSIYEILFQSLKSDLKGSLSSFGYLIWIRDITEEKLLERSKSELVAVVSHQLRTPLSVTKGNTEMLLDEGLGKLNNEQRRVISQTAESNERLIALVNQMLDITKIEKKRHPRDLKKLSIDKILEKTIKNISPYAKEKNVSIRYSGPKEKIPEILAYEDDLYKVFQNLIENAVDYCQNNKDKICPVYISIKSSSEKISVEISDSGVGIPKQEQNKIFERFYRASNAPRFKSGGTGLGLFIVKSVVENLGGIVKFESEEGKGTTFFITLPLANTPTVK